MLAFQLMHLGVGWQPKNAGWFTSAPPSYLDPMMMTDAPCDAKEYARWKSSVVLPQRSGP